MPALRSNYSSTKNNTYNTNDNDYNGTSSGQSYGNTNNTNTNDSLDVGTYGLEAFANTVIKDKDKTSINNKTFEQKNIIEKKKKKLDFSVLLIQMEFCNGSTLRKGKLFSYQLS